MVLLIGIIITFSLPRFSHITDNINLVKLKSQYTLIINSLNKYKTKNILLNKKENINNLDEAVVGLEKKKLFTKILDMTIISGSEVGNWMKNSEKNYSFILSKNKKVNFVLENNNFKCISEMIICEKLY